MRGNINSTVGKMRRQAHRDRTQALRDRKRLRRQQQALCEAVWEANAVVRAMQAEMVMQAEAAVKAAKKKATPEAISKQMAKMYGDGALSDIATRAAVADEMYQRGWAYHADGETFPEKWEKV